MSFAEEYARRLDAPPTDITLHLPRLFDTARGYAKPEILELGTRRGESTCALLAAAEESGGHVWSVDVDPPDVPAHWAGSPLWAFTVAHDMELEVPAGYGCDVLFVDTSHEFLHTLAELRKFVPLVRAGGVALFHDTEFGWEPQRYPRPGAVWHPVAAALDAYCYEHRPDMRWENHPGSYGLGVIERPNG